MNRARLPECESALEFRTRLNSGRDSQGFMYKCPYLSIYVYMYTYTSFLNIDISAYTCISYASAYMENSCFCMGPILSCEDDRIAGFLDVWPEAERRKPGQADSK